MDLFAMQGWTSSVSATFEAKLLLHNVFLKAIQFVVIDMSAAYTKASER